MGRFPSLMLTVCRLSPSAKVTYDTYMKYNLSSSAQSIVDAYSEANDCYDETLGQIAAALRAAAEVVAPLTYEDVWTDGRMLQYRKEDPVREKLLAIAAELENAE